MANQETPRKRRDRLYIIAEILAIANEEPVRQTHIMYKANLSMRQLYGYLAFLLERNLLEKVGKSYKTTRRGIKYLELHEELASLLRKAEVEQKQKTLIQLQHR